MSAVDELPALGSDGGSARNPPVLALDIGGTKLAAGVVDGDGRIHSFVVAPTITSHPTSRAPLPQRDPHRRWGFNG